MAAMKRATRVVGRLKEEISRMIARDLRDPRLHGVLITRVEMPDDMQLARVFFRLEAGDEAARAAARKGLGSAAGKLRSELAKTVQLRYTPELRFFYDDALDKELRIEGILAEIAADRAKEPKDGDDE